MDEHKDLLRKWLKVLFYAQIAAMAITVINAVTYLDNITAWILKAVNLVVIWSLFQLKDVNPRYRTASIAKVIALVCGLLTLPVDTLGLSSILLVVGSTAGWVASYQEYHGHGELIAEADEKLAKKWNNLFGLEIVIGIGISVVTATVTTVLVSTGMAAEVVTTIVLILSTVLGLVLDVLYLSYMKRTLALLEN